MGKLSVLMRLRLSWSIAIAMFHIASESRGDSTINPAHPAAWSANAGWINCVADGTHGAVIGEFVCSGFLYSGNVGWISLGSGTPANGIAYQNTSAGDFGVNHDGLGQLYGRAWAANVGWLLFTNRDAAGASFDGPAVDLTSGKLSGYVFSANTGWISLSNAVAFVQSDRIVPGADSDHDGIADAFELVWTGSLTMMNAASDLDGDGSADRSEYLAATDPTDPADRLEVTALSVNSGGTGVGMTWTSRSSRRYRLEKQAEFSTNSVWLDSGLGLITPDAGPTTSRSFLSPSSTQLFLRVEAVRPLSP